MRRGISEGGTHPFRRASDFPGSGRTGFAELQPFALLAALVIIGAILVARGLFPGPLKSIRLSVGEKKAIESPLVASHVRVTKETRAIEARVVDGRVEIEARGRSVSDMTVEWTNGQRDRFVVVVGAPIAAMHVRTPNQAPTREQLLASKVIMRPVKPLDRKLFEEEKKKKEPPVKLVDLKKPESPKDDTKPDGQVIELQQPAEEKRPEKSKYVSEFDARVANEMKSRHRKLPPSPMPMPIEGRPPAPKKVAVAGRATPKVSVREKVEEKRAFEPIVREESARRRFSLLDRKLALDPAGTLPRYDDPLGAKEPRRDATKAAPREDGRARQAPREATDDEGEDGAEKVRDLKDLMPSRETLKSIASGPVNDYLKGVDEGDRDMLNSRSWKYATFFNRVKRGVAQHWKPAGAYLRRDPNGNIYGLKDRYTVLHVTLAGGGELKDLRVHQTCGVDFLDGEAVQAFKDAQPFPNPPAGLKDPKGEIAFLFGFYFEISSRPQFRIFRYNN